MKILFFLLGFILSYNICFAQKKSGNIYYGVKMNDRFLKDINSYGQKNQKYETGVNYLKKIILNHKKIYSNDKPFLELSFDNYTYLLKPLDIMLPENLQGKFIFQSSIYYGNTKSNVYLNQFEKRGKTYIVPFNESYNWDVKNEQKNILGFQCRKAVIEKKMHSKKYNITNTSKIVAWFTPQIPIAFSPVRYYGLPGAILEVTTPMKHVYAKNIEFKDDVEIEKPAEGTKLSKEEYKIMMRPPKRPD